MTPSQLLDVFSKERLETHTTSSSVEDEPTLTQVGDQVDSQATEVDDDENDSPPGA